MSHLLRTLIPLLSLGLVLVSCGSDDEATPTATSAVEKSPSEPSPATPPAPSQAKTNPSIGKNAKLSELEAQVPKDVPLYPDAYSGFIVEDTGDDLVVVMESGGAGVADALDYYVDAIANQGWAIESETLQETNGEIIAYKGNRQMFVLTVTNGQETLVSVKVRPTPKQ